MSKYTKLLVALLVVLGVNNVNQNKTVQAVGGFLPDISQKDERNQLKEDVIESIKGKTFKVKELKRQINEVDERLKQTDSDYRDLFNYEIQNSQRVATIRSQYPGVTNTLSDEEVDFASRVGVTYFGDSLVAGSQNQFKQLFQNSNVQGVGSMQIAPEGLSRMGELVNKKAVAKVVVVVLGTNRGLEPNELNDMVSLLGDRYIFFVDTISEVGHKQEVAYEIQEVAKRYDNVYAIPFSSQSQASYYDSDRIHHSNQGKEAMVQFIAQHVYQAFYNTTN